jgi:hypothetical protein
MTCLGCLLFLHSVHTIHLAALRGLFLRRCCSVRGLRAPCLRRCSVRALRSAQLVGWGQGGSRGFAAREIDGDIFRVPPRPQGTWCKILQGFLITDADTITGFHFVFLFFISSNPQRMGSETSHLLFLFKSVLHSKFLTTHRLTLYFK